MAKPFTQLGNKIKGKKLGYNFLSLQGEMIINDSFQNKFSFSFKKIALFTFELCSSFICDTKAQPSYETQYESAENSAFICSPYFFL